MSPGANGKTKISFVWNPVPAAPGVRRETPAQCLADCRRRQFRSLSIAAKRSAPGRVEFEVPPGPIELEIAVEDAAKEVLDRETRKIDRAEPGPGPDAQHA